MKSLFSISLSFMLLLVFITLSTTSVLACENHKTQSEIEAHKSECPKGCCKKTCSDSKEKKKGCCGNHCSCTFNTIQLADLPKSFSINLSPKAVSSETLLFSYTQAIPQSSIQEIWQPPIAVLSK